MNTATPAAQAIGSLKPTPPKADVAIRAYTAFLVAATFFLVIAGGMVTSTGSALAVPDWPLSFGQFFPKMEGGVFYEHGHRLVAATVALLTVILAVWLWRKAEEPLLRAAGWLAVGVVMIQAVLGGVTVLFKLLAVTSVGHACVGQIFFSWIVCIAAMVWSERIPDTIAEAPKLRRLALMTTGFVLFQLLFGAIYRHTGMMLHLHFLGAALVATHIILLYIRVQKTAAYDVWINGPAVILLALLVLQVGLGFYTWQRPTISNATAHVAIGALLLASSAVISLETFRRVQA